ncbi:OsmC family peroxiredoxin [Microbacterium sp.]|uniref:OsmC family peroxiredoxin n=2 Tax=Microbacterium sp. TaxID=51671 RepID=UPI0037C80665
MPIAVRSIRTEWEGALATGSGVFAGGSSGALDGLPVTWAARTEQPGGKTSPEELAAAAHSSCFSMAFALRLGEHDVTPQHISVEATVTFDAVDGVPTITTSALKVRARIEGLDDDRFARIVDEAAELCPVSRLFAGARITVDAALEPAA